MGKFFLGGRQFIIRKAIVDAVPGRCWLLNKYFMLGEGIFRKYPFPNMIHPFNYTEYHSEELLSKLYHFVFFSINYGMFT